MACSFGNFKIEAASSLVIGKLPPEVPIQWIKINRLGLSVKLIGIYHSHPNHPCYPSGLDISQAFYPDTFFLIISLKDMTAFQLKAFKMCEGKIEEETIIFD